MRRRRPYVESGDEIEIFELKRGDEVLAKLEPVVQDAHANYPWMFANIFPSEAFDAVKDLFRELPEDENGRLHRQRLIDRRIVLCLRDPDFDPIAEFTMLVEGGLARFKIDENLEEKIGVDQTLEATADPPGS